MLHGAGGTPKTLFFPTLMEQRKAWCLGVAGRTAVTHERGAGFMWDGANVGYVLALTRHVLDKYPVRRERVLVWGHSAGGSMTLATLAEAPELFAGGLTTAAPQTPDGRHRDQRVAVLLGTSDPNWAGAPAVRTHLEGLEKKKGKGACAFLAVEGLGHDVPDPAYLGLGFDWLLSGRPQGGEARVPLRAVGAAGPWRHLLLRFKGAEGAPAELKTSKKAALELARRVQKDVAAGKAFFPLEASRRSEHAESAGAGGGLEQGALEALLGAPLPPLGPGQVSEVLESPRGVHLLYRDPA